MPNPSTERRRESGEPPAGLAAVDHAALSPLDFLRRSALVWADRVAVREHGRTFTYREHTERVERLAGWLKGGAAVAPGDRVGTLLPNCAAMLELHYAVPGVGAVLVPLNPRLTGDEYAYILDHAGVSLLVADEESRPAVEVAVRALGAGAPLVVWVDVAAPAVGEYERLVTEAEPLAIAPPEEERHLLSINYTSGTTARPKGVMSTHRGAYLQALGMLTESKMGPASGYLWTLPMFHCNGWAYTWATTAAGATHICIPRPDPTPIWAAIESGGVTHMCAAPTVLGRMLESELARPCPEPVRLFVGGSPPTPAALARAAALGIDITHLYGLTETYGPLVVCAWNPEWDDEDADTQAGLRARQGVGSVVSEEIRVVDDELHDVPADGQTLGEVVMRGNNVMAGYYRDPAATEEATRGGWFHSGDLAVKHPDGYVELRDRIKDVVISGGETIATVEIEQSLGSHPAVLEAAVVGRPDADWGEVPVAFVSLRPDSPVDPEELRDFLRERIARFKVPKRVVVMDELPKTATGKIQKFVLRANSQSET